MVTGASTGIGAATARMLAAQGAAVVLAARHADKLAELAGEITGNGGQAVPQPADTTSAADLARMVDRAVTEFRHLDWAAAIVYLLVGATFSTAITLSADGGQSAA